MLYYRHQIFPKSFVNELWLNNDIVDGRYGGLLLGPSHDEGGIVCGCLYSEGFCVLSELEGYEYVVNNKSQPLHKSQFSEINNSQRDKQQVFIPPTTTPETPIIDARRTAHSKYNAKFLILSRNGGEGIVNMHSTRIFINALNKINEAVPWHPY